MGRSAVRESSTWSDIRCRRPPGAFKVGPAGCSCLRTAHQPMSVSTATAITAQNYMLRPLSPQRRLADITERPVLGVRPSASSRACLCPIPALENKLRLVCNSVPTCSSVAGSGEESLRFALVTFNKEGRIIRKVGLKVTNQKAQWATESRPLPSLPATLQRIHCLSPICECLSHETCEAHSPK